MQSLVQPARGLLLEQFARLAADVAAAPAALVGVLGQRNDRGPVLAGFGLPREHQAPVAAIDKALESAEFLTIVPDLAADCRLDAVQAPLQAAGFRFLCHLKLLSPGGERIGFISVLDRCARPALTKAQQSALAHIAETVVADRRREQRHRHLMHVADRALRVDRMLRLVSEATTCADALTDLLEELCRFHGAAIGRIWQLARAGEPMHEVSRYDQDSNAANDPGLAEPMLALSAMTLEAIDRNQPHSIDFARRKSSAWSPDALTPSFFGQVSVPIRVQQQRFGISLAFTADHADLDAVTADIASLADTIRPALFRKVAEERIRFAAHHDDLTQLSNRLMFQEHLQRSLAAARSSEHGLALLYLDLDGFKSVNDTRGHAIGDMLLVTVAQRLRESLREGDTVARIGGDEFAIIQPLGSQPAASIALARRLIETTSQPAEIAGNLLSIGVSIGIALYPQDGDSSEQLLRNADIALYRAKQAGRNTFRLLDEAVPAVLHERLLVAQDMKDALDGKHFTLAYQPVCDSISLHAVGFEALLRWNNPPSGPVQPDHFIRLAEANGFIVPLGRWALEAACAEAASWDPSLYLSVNLSPLQFRQPDLHRQIAAILHQTGLPAERLDLEVTEGLLLEESDLVLRTMRALQELGIRITLDDFGTAYASLSYLRRFPFDAIKIDKSFIKTLCEDESTQAIVQAVLSLSERLNLTVVAEGVETEPQLAALRTLGCRFVQGYLSGRPLENHPNRALLHPLGRRSAPRGIANR